MQNGGMRRGYLLLLLLAMVALFACGRFRRKAGAGQFSDHKIVLAGLERTYTVYTPAGGPGGTMLALLHGGGGKASGMIGLARGMQTLADMHGILLVYPDGTGGHWNDGRRDISAAARENVNDVAFLRAIAAAYTQNIRRVFVAGMSNGGMMAQRVACEMPDVVAGVVSIAANMPAELAPVCNPQAPVSVMFINGVQDPIVPYAGGEIKILRNARGTVLSTEDSLAFWQKQGGCTALPDMPFTANSVKRDYRCTRGRLRLIRVSDGGHAWPGGSPYLPGFMIGKTSSEFSASEQIVEFILQNQR